MQVGSGLISVIVPIYNAQKYLVKCLDSIVGQTYTDLEIILVDDGSVDRSGKICDHYAQKDKRIRVIHKENQGVSAARNDGIRESVGKYIAFVDADDYILPDYFAYLYGLLQKYDVDMACCNFYKMWDTEMMPKFRDRDTEMVFTASEAMQDFLYNKNITGHPFLKLYKRTYVEQFTFPEKMHYSEDIFFVFHMLQKCKSVAYGDRILYIYIQNDTSATHNFDLMKLRISWRMLQKELMGYSKADKELFRPACSRLFTLAVLYCSAMRNGREETDFWEELLATVRKYGSFIVKDGKCKSLIRLMAAVSRISPRLLICLCKMNVFFRRKFRIAVRRSV